MIQTTEKINGQTIDIKWVFWEIEERHDSNWCVWSIAGEDEEGNTYTALCQADGDNPEYSMAEITDIEIDEIKTPEPKSNLHPIFEQALKPFGIR